MLFPIIPLDTEWWWNWPNLANWIQIPPRLYARVLAKLSQCVFNIDSCCWNQHGISMITVPPYISPPPPYLTLHTTRRHGSQQGAGQLRGDFNLSEKIHIKPLMPPFTIILLCLLCSLPGTHRSSLPPLLSSLLLPFDSDHWVSLRLLFLGSILLGRWTGGEEMGSRWGECVYEIEGGKEEKQERGRNFFSES